MADSSFELQYHPSSTSHRRGHSHSTPVSSTNVSRSFTSSISHNMSYNSTVGRYHNPTPTTPFASDNDMSWKAEISWQIEPNRWLQNRNLGSILSPWASNTPLESKIFGCSANDYYLSHTTVGLRDYTNPYYENSSNFNGVNRGRIELQSYVARDNESSYYGKGYLSGEHSKSPCEYSKLRVIKEKGKNGNSPLASKDELSMTDFDSPEDDVDSIGFSHTRHHHHDHDDSLSDIDHEPSEHHFGHDHLGVHMDHGHDGISHIGHGQGLTSHVGHDGNNAWPSNSHHDGAYNDMDEEDDYDDEEPAKSVGLFSLFRYSTKWDLVLVFLGCLGALINGGSLPWYSYLFGDFVNRIAKETNKTQMMKDVEKVYMLIEQLLFYPFQITYCYFSFHISIPFSFLPSLPPLFLLFPFLDMLGNDWIGSNCGNWSIRG